MHPTLSNAAQRLPTSSSLQHASSNVHARKMAALVHLYHQCDRFITPATLSDAIDEAFTKRLTIPNDKQTCNLAELFQMRSHQRWAPRFSLGRDNHFPYAGDSLYMGPGWTESKEKRVDRIYEALMGTTKGGKASWTAVEENSDRIEAQLVVDRRRSK